MMQLRVFLDANVIIEAFRIDVWGELSRGLDLETVEMCEREALTGETTAYGRVFVNAEHLAAGLASSHVVARSERNALFRANRLCTDMDAGEKDLFAHIFSHHKTLPAHIVVSTADKGVLVRANEFGWLQNIVSLEALLKQCNVSRQKIAALNYQYGEEYLKKNRLKVRMGIIP